MKFSLPLCLLLLAAPAFAGPGLTIYNQNFAVVRDALPLRLQPGVNEVVYENATVHLEPDSVILRSPGGGPLNILEQNYRNDPLSEGLLLSLFEGKEIDFLVKQVQKPDQVIKGKIIRSGYVPHYAAMGAYGNQYAARQMAMAGPAGAGQPVIEVDGKIQFGLPGQPIFPSLGDDTILKPRLTWKIDAAKAAEFTAELGYITGGMSWNASYNVVAPEKGDKLDLTGWITMDNQSGRDFPEARIKLMAGDVNKLAPPGAFGETRRREMAFAMNAPQEPAVTEKAFDEYHLYTLQRPTTLRDRETKQVEFVRATGIPAKTVYIYDGVSLDPNRWRGADQRYRLTSEEMGTESQTKVAVFREFENTKKNGLGIPLPKGRVRFYRADGDQLEFTGENEIDHTPADEKLKIYTGDSFDLVGERKRTSFEVNTSEKWVDEAFEIKVRNRKKEPVTIRVVEHLYRGYSWEIVEKNREFEKKASDEIVFEVPVQPGEEETVTYKVHYTW